MTGAEAIWDALAQVADPELPLLSIIDLGVIDSVEVDEQKCWIEYTPTMVSCPAARMIGTSIHQAVSKLGFEVEVRRKVSPAWTRARLTDTAKEKMRSIGISTTDLDASGYSSSSRLRILNDGSVECPHCGSTDTKTDNVFGGACCRSLRYCRSCRQPFQYFRLS